MDKVKEKFISVKKLKIIDNDKGKVMHALKRSESSFDEFGEIYFSKIEYNSVKAWKKHKNMIMNLVVPVGSVKFVFYNEQNKDFEEITLGPNNYSRITVLPNIWFGFQGLFKGNNLVMNLSNIEHDPSEVRRKELSEIDYKW